MSILNYYDPKYRLMLQHDSATADPTWIAVNDAYAATLATAISAGSFIYVNADNFPVIYTPNIDQTLQWDETGFLTEPIVIDGEVSQQFIVTEMSIPDKLAKLNLIKFAKIEAGSVPVRLSRKDADGNDIYIPISTSSTISTLFLGKAVGLTINPTTPAVLWKVQDGDFELIDKDDFIAAAVLMDDFIETQVHIEYHFTTLIQFGIRPDISNWVLPQGYNPYLPRSQ